MQAATANPIHHALPLPSGTPRRYPVTGYLPYEYELQEIAGRLRRHGYRGAIVGPAGCGKSVLLQALGDELMAHGLTPLPLIIKNPRSRELPSDWQRTIRQARHTDALLLDDYDTLSTWARLWVYFASRRAGAVVVTAASDVRFKTLARPKPTPALLRQLLEQIAPGKHHQTDCHALLTQCNGNLHQALQLAQRFMDHGSR